MQAIIERLQCIDSLEATGVILAFLLFVFGIVFVVASLVDMANEAAAMRRRRMRAVHAVARINRRFANDNRR